MNLQSSREVLAAIVAIFPEFEAEWEEDNPYRVGGKFSAHSVYMKFLPFLASAKRTDKQMKRVAQLINGAVLAGGDSENAVTTCFLEHLRQVGLTSTLKPLLGCRPKIVLESDAVRRHIVSCCQVPLRPRAALGIPASWRINRGAKTKEK